MINAWDLSEDEFNMYRDQIPVSGDKRGTYKSINGNTIEIKSNRRSPVALTYTYTFYLNGKRLKGTTIYMRRLLMELPDDYPYFVVYDLVRRYAAEKGYRPHQMLY